jgi:O-antigen/teichoic acid export membrane protein
MAMMTAVNVAKAAAALALSILIARVVPPGEYGLVALAVAVMALLMLLTDLGLASAIVRHPELDKLQAGSAVGLLAVAGLLAGLVLVALAVPLEAALHMPKLADVMIGFGGVAALSTWATAPRALLERRLAYGRVSALEGVALAAGLLAFAAGVRLGMGILALVAFHFTLQFLRAVGFTVLARQHYSIGLSFSRISELARVGGWVFLTNLLSYSARNVDRMLIAAVLGASSLGLYAFAYQFMTVPLVLITWPASGVLLAALSRIPTGSPDRPAVVSAMFTVTALITFPLMAFFAFGLHFPIEAFFGDRWSGAAEIIAMMSAAGAAQSLAAYNGAVLVSMGAVRLNFRLALLNGLGLTAVFALTVNFGIIIMTASYVIAALCIYCVLIVASCRAVGIGPRVFFGSMAPGAVATVAGLAAVAATVGFDSGSLREWLSCAAIYGLSAALSIGLTRHALRSALRALRRGAPTALTLKEHSLG